MGLFPIAKAKAYIAGVATDLEHKNNTLRWSSYDGITELTVSPINYETFDGLKVIEEVTLTHVCPALTEISASQAAQINRFALISCLVPGSSNSPSKFVCKAGLFSADLDAAERLYAPLICTEAAVIGWYAACLGRQILKANPDSSPIFKTGENPPYDVADFESVKAFSTKKGFAASSSVDGFTVEFPWEPGAFSAMFSLDRVKENARKNLKLSEEEIETMAGATSLLQLLVMEHPLIGKGIQSRLEIPLYISPGEGVESRMLEVVSELNAWELTGADLPPLFGAWCCGPRAPTFVSFYPTQYCVPGMLHNLFHWARLRQWRARQWLSVGPSRH